MYGYFWLSYLCPDRNGSFYWSIPPTCSSRKSTDYHYWWHFLPQLRQPVGWLVAAIPWICVSKRKTSKGHAHWKIIVDDNWSRSIWHDRHDTHCLFSVLSVCISVLSHLSILRLCLRKYDKKQPHFFLAPLPHLAPFEKDFINLSNWFAFSEILLMFVNAF